jgi:3-deoxy-D-arabino-heptulosonate 7-phosphate (DAHP) synthase
MLDHLRYIDRQGHRMPVSLWRERIRLPEEAIVAETNIDHCFVCTTWVGVVATWESDPRPFCSVVLRPPPKKAEYHWTQTEAAAQIEHEILVQRLREEAAQ